MENINSMFWWEGEIVNDSESLIIAKTLQNKFEKIKTTVNEIHIYEVPCIVAIPIIKSSEDYKKWLNEELVD